MTRMSALNRSSGGALVGVCDDPIGAAATAKKTLIRARRSTGFISRFQIGSWLPTAREGDAILARDRAGAEKHRDSHHLSSIRAVAKPVTDSIQRMRGVVRNGRSLRLDLMHRRRQLERQPALRFRRAGDHVKQR